MELDMIKQRLDYTVQVIATTSTMEGVGGGVERNLPNARVFALTQLALRASVIVFTLAAIIVTITTKQTVNVGLLEYEARYTDSSAIRFQVGANAAVCAFSFLSVLILPGLIHPKSDPNNYFYLLLHDMVMTMLLLSGCAASSAVGYLAKKGQEQGSWIAICKYVEKFCNKMEVALALAYLALFCMLALTVMAAQKLKSHQTIH